MFEVRISTIRYWENKFDVLKPKRNRNGNRLFTATDMENLKIINYLIKERGFTIQGAIDKMKGNRTDTIDTVEIVDSLKKVKAFLLDIKAQL